jgi:hypothetical protein
LLTSNIYLIELIDALRNYPNNAYETGIIPFGTNLTVLGVIQCEKAFPIFFFFRICF